MSLRARFYLALASSVIVIGIHWVVNSLYLYWTIPNIDVPMHILGGVMSGLYIGCALMALKMPPTYKSFVLGVIVIGIGWELLEIATMSLDYSDGWYPIDTTKDMIDDIIGGTLAYFIWRKL